MKTRTLVIVIVLLLGIAVLVRGRKHMRRRRSLAGRTITGTVYFVSGRRPGLSLPFTLIINRITTAEEVSHLNAALQEGKQDELCENCRTRRPDEFRSVRMWAYQPTQSW
jgi:hypothetical protein